MADRHYKLRPLEILLTLAGLAIGGALASFFFRALPDHPELLSDSGAAALLHSRVFQIVVLAAPLLTMAAGLADRVSRGSERATTLLVVGNVIAFVAALMVYFSLARGG
jgi:hypothetical protein